MEDIVVHLGRKVLHFDHFSPTVEIRSSYFCSKSIIESNQFLLKTLISSSYLIRQIFLGYHVEIRHCFAIFTSRVIWLYACILFYLRPRSVIWAIDLSLNTCGSRSSLWILLLVQISFLFIFYIETLFKIWESEYK